MIAAERRTPPRVESHLPYVMTRQRLKKTTGPPGPLITPGRVGIVILCLAAVWLASGFASKMVVAYRLNAEVAQLRMDTERLQVLNHGYQSQLAALAQPGGKEEQERLHNYVQHDEKVYVIAQPSPLSTLSPRGAPSANRSTAATRSSGFWQDLWGAVTSPFR